PTILSEPLLLLSGIQLPQLESPVISLSRSKQKALQGRELQSPAILSEPLAFLSGIQLRWLALRV
ncbi:hypothetical protein ACQKOD_00750, partial [Bacillus mycoides]|uniref:hypothetical protein n=1 Tax=Bacillus mycoides TaxID=1405 RepID=UPI003D07FE82